MKKYLLCAALLLLAVPMSYAAPAETIPLGDATGPWLALTRSDNPALRRAALTALADLIRKHPAMAREVVHNLSSEQNPGLATEFEQFFVPLAKESPATVSAFIQHIRPKETTYQARNLCVKVLSQAGPAAATPEFLEAMAETYCPVPGAYYRILRALSKDGAPVLAAGFRHPNEFIRRRINAVLRNLARTEPVLQRLLSHLEAEPPLVQKLRQGTPPDRIVALTTLVELARVTPGTAKVLVQGLKDERDRDVLNEAQNQLILLGRDSSEAVAALVAGVRSEDDYRLRNLAVKVLPHVGSQLNCREMVEAMADEECPVPGAMRRILLAAGPDALPVLTQAMQHKKPEARHLAADILKRMPQPATQPARP